MTTSYIQKRIIAVLVDSLLGAGFLIDVNDNDGDRETHAAHSGDRDAILAAIFDPELDCVDYVLDLSHSDRNHPERGNAHWVRLIDGNGTAVISDYTTNLESLVAPANDFADMIDEIGDENFVNHQLAAGAALLEALKPFANEFVADDAACHVGITTKEKCARCGRILAARAAIAKAEHREPARTTVVDREGNTLTYENRDGKNVLVGTKGGG